MKQYQTLLILLISLSLTPSAFAKCYPGLDCPEDLPNTNAGSKSQPEPVQTPESSVEPEPETNSKYKKYRQTNSSANVSANTQQISFDYDIVTINGGCFLMGSSTNEPERGQDETQHEVCLPTFKIGQHEVSQAQWQAIMGNNPASIKNDNFPVDNVSYQDIQQFIQKLNQQTGETYRLPTEAEWEYAARAGSSTPFYTGDCITSTQANYDNNSHYNNCPIKKSSATGAIVAIGSYPANAWRLYDMLGNAYEWTCSEYDEHYTGKEQHCSNSTDPSTVRVIRGGAWNSKANQLRSAFRNYEPSNLNEFLGFRLVK